MIESNKDDNLRIVMSEADRKSFEGRLKRLQFLMEHLNEGYAPFPAVVLEYFEETKLCFYEGAFVASVLMASATFEELFRQVYRDRNEKRKVGLRLVDLIDCAVQDHLISSDEEKKLTKLRKMRNKLTHIKIGFKDTDFRKKRTMLDLILLWGDPRKENLPVEIVAEDSMRTFARLVPDLCTRFWGA